MDLTEIWVGNPAAIQVAEFNLACGHTFPNLSITAADIGTDEETMLYGLIVEEKRELEEARAAGDIVGIIDALQDLKYVIYGYELRMGISSEEHFAEVHAANMRKVDPVTGKVIRREDGKILKPEGWTGPDHESLLSAISDTGGIYMQGGGTETVH